jgi:hypothetical protein
MEMVIEEKKANNTSDKPNWTLLEEYKNPKLDALFNVYAIDKDKAKIYYHLNEGHFATTRKVLFEYPNGDFKFVRITKTYGISSTNKMYSREKTVDSIMYKNGRFYRYDNTGKKPFIQSLNYNGIHWFTNSFGHHDIIIDYITKRFGWIRYISEDPDPLTRTIIFDTVIKKKLFNKKAMYRHIYGCPYPIASFIHEYTSNTRNPQKYLKVWKEIRKTLYNIENLKLEFFKHHIFQDTCRMARMVGEKVNCSWGIKRLTSEHDKWSKIITQVLLENEPLMDLKVHPIFVEFAEHSGYKLLTTNHELIAEGNQMNHCVGTYSKNVDTGYSGIYRAHDHTLELRRNGDEITISQYMGYSNVRANASLFEKVESALGTFKPSKNYSGFFYEVNDEFDLPF